MLCLQFALRANEWDISSDVLYLQQLSDDLFFHPTPIDHWALQPAPSLFPDGVLIAALRLFDAQPVRLILLYGATTAALYFAVSLWVAQFFFKDKATRFSVASLPLCVFLIQFSDRSARSSALLPAHHASALLVALCAAALCVQIICAEEPQRWRAPALSALLGLAMASDALTLLQATLPLALAATWPFGALVARRAWLQIVVALLAAFAVQSVAQWLLKKHGLVVPVEPPALGIDRLRSGWSTLYAYAKQYPFDALLIFAFGVDQLFLAWTRMFARSSPQQQTAEQRGRAFLFAFLGFSFSATVFGAWYGGYLWEPGRVRYVLMSVALIPAMHVSLRAASIEPPRLARYVAGARVHLLALGCLSLWALTHVAKLPVRTHVPDNVTDAISCVDQIAKTHDVRTGLGGYWSARRLTMMSHEHVEFAAMTEEFKPSIWIANGARQRRVLSAEDVIIHMRDLDEVQVLRNRGEPDARKTCNREIFWLYGPRFRQVNLLDK